MPFKKTNLVFRFFWSLYFALSIGVIGLFAAYLFTLPAYLLAFIFSAWPAISSKILIFSENVLCSSIRLLLNLQPWLRCEAKFANIWNFYDQFKTRRILFVGNHRSNLDTFLLISYIPGLRGLAKHSLFYNIFFAPIMLTLGFIPVKKGNSESFREGLTAIKEKILKKNNAVLIFPENTRCNKNFKGMGKMSRSFFSMAIEANALVVPIAIQKSDLVMGRGDLFLHPGEIKIDMLDPIDSSKFKDGKVLAEFVRNKILGAMYEA